MRTVTIALVSLALGLCAPARAQEAPELAGLFEQLGSESYEAREAAGRALLELGPSIHEALRAYAKESGDPEVRARAAYIEVVWEKRELERHGPGYIGINISNATDPIAGETVTQVTSLVSGAPGEAAGLKVGDLVVSVDGIRARGTSELIALVKSIPAGRTVDLKVLRPTEGGGAEELSISLTLARRPTDLAQPEAIPPQIIPLPAPNPMPAPVLPGKPRVRIQVIPAKEKDKKDEKEAGPAPAPAPEPPAPKPEAPAPEDVPEGD